ncbi:MAG: CsbD family protein [Mycolicibacterium sp.]|nr:CsbD family protein [Mycolicibacterium sp.]
MGATDKAKNKVQRARGKAKETIGRVTGDPNLERQGSGERVKSNLKDAGEKVKDAFRGSSRESGRRRG